MLWCDVNEVNLCESWVKSKKELEIEKKKGVVFFFFQLDFWCCCFSVFILYVMLFSGWSIV